ncbi:neutral and basic amino acid transport protein rBAT isoform X2 [Zerene cesonia]|nr:neutral and basic amino acid transport protein rBAT isoform X2 [Zerene cesonia]XP_038206474.1 neutral and basic amino acid transport protein rBAT isoform X2 [Zerene cesonia]
MADAKYVVEDHRNGDAKIELDANKRQFTGLTKEELMKYAEDPFWIRLRWFMFVLFWAMWFCMLAGAIAIIVRAPKCAPPPPRTWYEKGPLVDVSSVEDYAIIEPNLQLLKDAQVAGVFVSSCKDAYEVLDNENASCLQQFKDFVAKAKSFGVKVIVDLTANFVPLSHKWFQLSENRSEEYKDYFIWQSSQEYDADEPTGTPKPPNSWVSTENEPAWSWSEKRKEFYLHLYGADQPQLNFNNTAVVKRFDDVLKIWMKAGADGIRLQKARELVVNVTRGAEVPRSGSGSQPAADHTQHAFWRHRHTTDQPELDGLLAHWAHLVRALAAEESVFTIAETGGRPELFLLARNTSWLRPAGAAPRAPRPAAPAAAALRERLPRWPLLQLTSEEPSLELAVFSMLLPAAPVLALEQLTAPEFNSTAGELLSQLSTLRGDASIEHGRYALEAAPAHNDTGEVLVCARWKAGHTGYAAAHNAGAAARANLTALAALPAQLSVHLLSPAAREASGYNNAEIVHTDDVLIPEKSTVIFSFVPQTTAEH